MLAACEADLREACLAGPCSVSVSSGGGASSASGGPATTTSGVGGANGGAGGTGGNETPPCVDETDVGDFPCEVFEVLNDKCHVCHQDPPDNGAPFSLLTYEDTQKPYSDRQRWERMTEVVEDGAVPSMPFGDAPDLTTTQLNVLRKWFKACAPPAPDGEGCE